MRPLDDLRPRERRAATDTTGTWLEAFHRGDRAIIELCYREHFAAIERAVGVILPGPDRETVIHELFSRLMARAEVRAAFRGGAIGAWLVTVARNQAIDYRRRFSKETALLPEDERGLEVASWEEATQARIMIDRFRERVLRREWASVFEARFVQQLSQHEAAKALGLSRTTLAYRELRIRRDLRRFVLEGDDT